MSKSIDNPELSIYNKFTPRHIFYTSLKHWYVFAIVIAVTLSVKFYLLRYSVPVYQVKSSLYIKGDKKSYGGAENFISGLSILNNSKSIQSEMEAINSYKLVHQTVEDLNLDVSYFVYGNIKEGELYKQSPITIVIDTTFNNIKGVAFVLEIENSKEFTIYKRIESNDFVKLIWPAKIYDKEFIIKGKFGEQCQSDYFRLTIHRSPNMTENYKGDTKFYFKINDIDNITWKYLSNMKLELTSKYSNIINFSVNGTVPEKDMDFLNKLMETYIANGLAEKNEIVTNTIIFIDLQLGTITDSLKGAENELQKFRATNSISLENSSESAVTKLSKLEDEKQAMEVKIRYYKYLQEYIASDRDIKEMIVPSAANINDPLLTKLVAELYGYISEQNNLPFSARDKNPSYKLLELKIQNTKTALNENIDNLIKSTDIYLKDNIRRIDELRSLLGELPRQERDLLDIKRKFTINDNMYNYLLSKRIEASIAKAANVPDNKIMNKAMQSGMISPNVSLINRYSNLIMLIVPFGIILFIMYTDDKVKNKETLTYLSKIPIIGVVSHYEGKEKIPVIASSKSRLSESIRSIRINLQYVLPGNDKCSVVGITSSISGEGKSFFSMNMAASIASTGKKVVLIGTDMRKPTLQNYVTIGNEKGLSSYLIAKHSLEEVVVPSGINDLDLILSGPIPPNPAELMGSERMAELITKLKEKFDYIIIDSPPIILVSDYFVLSKYVDATIYIVRQNYTTIPMVKEISSIVEEKNIKHSVWVLNDMNKSGSYQYGYGYSYGTGYGYGYNYDGYSYGYYDDKYESIFTRWKRKFKQLVKKD